MANSEHIDEGTALPFSKSPKRKGGRPALLSPDDRDEIRRRIDKGALGKDLAQEFGVSPMVISRIRNAHVAKSPTSAARIAFRSAQFWSRVDVGEENECWPFDRATLDAYGYFGDEISGSALAHVTAYVLAHPGEPRPEVIRHLCDNRSCCNPAHLKPGTSKDNAADRRRRKALEATGHTGPTPVTNPMPAPAGGWTVETDVEVARAALKMDVLRTKIVVDVNGCWIWTEKATHTFGYGQIAGMSAHRYSFLHSRGYLPAKGAWVLHACGVAACCNPDHLYEGTPKQNAEDTTRHGKRKVGTEHHKARFTHDQVLNIRQSYWKDGLSLDQVAAEASAALGTISRILKGEAYAASPGPTGPDLRGAHGRRLNIDLVTQGRQRAKAGESIHVIARDLGVHVETLREAVTGKSWKHVAESPFEPSK